MKGLVTLKMISQRKESSRNGGLFCICRLEYAQGMGLALELSLLLWLGMVEVQSMGPIVRLGMELVWQLELLLDVELGMVQELWMDLVLGMEQRVALQMPQVLQLELELELEPHALLPQFEK